MKKIFKSFTTLLHESRGLFFIFFVALNFLEKGCVQHPDLTQEGEWCYVERRGGRHRKAERGIGTRGGGFYVDTLGG